MCPLSCCYSLVHLAHTHTHSESLRTYCVGKHIIQLDSKADKRYVPSIDHRFITSHPTITSYPGRFAHTLASASC